MGIKIFLGYVKVFVDFPLLELVHEDVRDEWCEAITFDDSPSSLLTALTSLTVAQTLSPLRLMERLRCDLDIRTGIESRTAME